MVNCIKLHDQIESVRNTRIGSSAIFFSLNESKNSMMSAAVPGSFEIAIREKYCLSESRQLQRRPRKRGEKSLTNVDQQQLRELIACQIPFRQQPTSNYQDEHEKLLDQSNPRLSVHIQLGQLYVHSQELVELFEIRCSCCKTECFLSNFMSSLYFVELEQPNGGYDRHQIEEDGRTKPVGDGEKREGREILLFWKVIDFSVLRWHRKKG